MRSTIALLATGAFLAGQAVLAAPAFAGTPAQQVVAGTSSAAKATAKSTLRVVINGAPTGKVTVKGSSIRRTVKKNATLRVPAGRYTVRAATLSTDGQNYAPAQRRQRVTVKPGTTTIVTATYQQARTSTTDSVSQTPQQQGPTGDMAVLFDLVNKARSTSQQCGTTTMPAVGPVKWNDAIADAATKHAQDMAAQNYFSHVSRDGRTFVERIEASNYAGYPGGENIASGFQNPSDVVAGWLASPGHCANLMTADFVDMGLGFASRTDAGYSLPVTYWVQNFGYGK